MSLCYGTRLVDYPCAILHIRCWDCPRAEDHRLMQVARDLGFDINVSDALTILFGDCPRMEPGDGVTPCGGWLPDLYKEHVCGRPERGGKLRVIK